MENKTFKDRDSYCLLAIVYTLVRLEKIASKSF